MKQYQTSPFPLKAKKKRLMSTYVLEMTEDERDALEAILGLVQLGDTNKYEYAISKLLVESPVFSGRDFDALPCKARIKKTEYGRAVILKEQ